MRNTYITHNENISSKNKGLVQHAKSLILKLNWLSPTSSLISKGGRDFGRQIEASIKEITQKQGIMRIQLRKRDAAVVMSVDHYEEMLSMKKLYSELIERVKEKEIAHEADEFEALYRRIASPESRASADALFSASTEDLNKAYQPGKTETQ
jgi:PHD/YefM family antitoxin component YafN of YafNO toxin-antitoxin module